MTNPATGDRIFLRGLKAECIIGFIDWERRVPQTVVLDLELPVDCARAACTDDVADTLDYKQVAKRIIAFVSESQFKLVARRAHRGAGACRICRGVGAGFTQQAGRHPRLARCRRPYRTN
jgi:dihydroneopterin aldolase